MPVAQLLEGEADTIEVGRIALALMLGIRLNGDEVISHRPNLLQDTINHHLEVRTARSHDVDQDNPVQGTYRMVGNRDECPFGQVVQDLRVMQTVLQLNQRVAKQGTGEGRTTEMAAVLMCLIHLIDRQPFQQTLSDESPKRALEKRSQRLQILYIDNCFLHITLFIDK